MRRRRPSRRRSATSSEGEFWRHRPIESDEPAALHAFGSAAVVHGDARAMMAGGWALCVTAGPHDDAVALLRDGFRIWRDGPGYEASSGRRFLEQLIGELMKEPAADMLAGGADGLLEAYHNTRCWAASELLDLGVEPVMERLLYGVVTRSVAAFVPARSAAWAMDYAARHDLTPPWGERGADGWQSAHAPQ